MFWKRDCLADGVYCSKAILGLNGHQLASEQIIGTQQLLLND